jgi:transposase-like protein
MKKTYTADFKAKVLLEILKEENTLTQLSSEYEVSVAQLSRWKTMALTNLPRLFDAEDKKVQEARLAQKKKEDELYQEIGRLAAQLEWLKKIWHHPARGMNAYQC